VLGLPGTMPDWGERVKTREKKMKDKRKISDER
jgi:hypothetical protein